jgi:hypothetical protein
MRVMLQFFLIRNYNFSENETYRYHGYILYEVDVMFSQSLLHCQHIFFHLCMRCSMVVVQNSLQQHQSSVHTLTHIQYTCARTHTHARAHTHMQCVSAHHRLQNSVMQTCSLVLLCSRRTCFTFLF